MHTHFFTLDAQRHVDFLNEQRHDPVTGEVLRAGDEVAFCASCGSAFLRDSWEYLGESHCGQGDTLETFPETPKEIARFSTQPGEILYSKVNPTRPKPAPPPLKAKTLFKEIGLMTAFATVVAALMAYFASTPFLGTFGVLMLVYALSKIPYGSSKTPKSLGYKNDVIARAEEEQKQYRKSGYFELYENKFTYREGKKMKDYWVSRFAKVEVRFTGRQAKDKRARDSVIVLKPRDENEEIVIHYLDITHYPHFLGALKAWQKHTEVRVLSHDPEITVYLDELRRTYNLQF